MVHVDAGPSPGDGDTDLGSDGEMVVGGVEVKTGFRWMKCAGCVGVTILSIVTLGSIGMITHFFWQYVHVRAECIEQWGMEAANWCSVKQYHPNGLFGDTSCHCRVIQAPNCDNGLNKTLPAEVFTKLGSQSTVAVYGGFCNLVGEIPDSIGEIDSLETVSLTVNDLNGTIPWNLGMSASLKYLVLSENRLNGEIPASFSNATEIEYLSFANNVLEGEIMPFLELFNDGNLRHMYLYGNHFTGNISLGEMSEFDIFKDWSISQLIQWIRYSITDGNLNLQLISSDGQVILSVEDDGDDDTNQSE